MKLEDGDNYKIEFLEDTVLPMVTNADDEPLYDEEYSAGDTVEAEVCELDEKKGTCTLYFGSDGDGDDEFARDIPIANLKALEKRVCVWVTDEDEDEEYYP